MTSLSEDPPRAGVAGTPPPEPQPPEAQPRRSRSGARGCFVLLLQISLILGVVAVLIFGLLVWQLQQSYKPPHAVPAGAAWTTTEVTLSAERSSLAGHVTIGVIGLPAAGVRIGVNAGAPTFGDAPTRSGERPSIEPNLAIGGPLVRLTAMVSGSPTTCVAPCELQVPPAFECTNGTCRMAIEVEIRLVATGTGGRGVTLSIAGGVSASPQASPPGAVTTELTFEPGAAPGAT